MNFTFIKYFLFIIITLLIGHKLLAHDYYLGQLTIDHPYITKPMPGMKHAAGYMVIKNKGTKTKTLKHKKYTQTKSNSKKLKQHKTIIKNTTVDKKIEQ